MVNKKALAKKLLLVAATGGASGIGGFGSSGTNLIGPPTAKQDALNKIPTGGGSIPGLDQQILAAGQAGGRGGGPVRFKTFRAGDIVGRLASALRKKRPISA